MGTSRVPGAIQTTSLPYTAYYTIQVNTHKDSRIAGTGPPGAVLSNTQDLDNSLRGNNKNKTDWQLGEENSVKEVTYWKQSQIRVDTITHSFPAKHAINTPEIETGYPVHSLSRLLPGVTVQMSRQLSNQPLE